MPVWLSCSLSILGGWSVLALLLALVVGKGIKLADQGGDGMARKAKHDQKTIPDGYVCTYCAADCCNSCIDVTRVAIGATVMVCSCKRKNHAGEARDNQVVDPETGTVWAPGLRVTSEGEVLRGGHEH